MNICYSKMGAFDSSQNKLITFFFFNFFVIHGYNTEAFIYCYLKNVSIWGMHGSRVEHAWHVAIADLANFDVSSD